MGARRQCQRGSFNHCSISNFFYHTNENKLGFWPTLSAKSWILTHPGRSKLHLFWPTLENVLRVPLSVVEVRLPLLQLGSYTPTQSWRNWHTKKNRTCSSAVRQWHVMMDQLHSSLTLFSTQHLRHRFQGIVIFLQNTPTSLLLRYLALNSAHVPPGYLAETATSSCHRSWSI